jgi:hypothetical protein
LAADSETKPGPLQSILNRIEGLQRDVDRLMHEADRTRRYIESVERENYNRKKHNPHVTHVGGTTPTWAVYDEWSRPLDPLDEWSTMYSDYKDILLKGKK